MVPSGSQFVGWMHCAPVNSLDDIEKNRVPFGTPRLPQSHSHLNAGISILVQSCAGMPAAYRFFLLLYPVTIMLETRFNAAALTRIPVQSENPSSENNRPLLERLATEWNSHIQERMKRALPTNLQGKVAVCARTADGNCTVYITKELVEKLDESDRSEPLLQAALEVLGKGAKYITDRPFFNKACLYFNIGDIEHEVRLHCEPGDDGPQRKIIDLEIYTVLGKVFPPEENAQDVPRSSSSTSLKRDAESRESPGESAAAPIKKLNTNTGSPTSSAERVLALVAQQGPDRTADTLPGHDSTTAAYQQTDEYASSSLTLAFSSSTPASTSGAQNIPAANAAHTIFDVIEGNAPPSALPTHHPGVIETLRTAAKLGRYLRQTLAVNITGICGSNSRSERSGACPRQGIFSAIHPLFS
jgi:hypothetical protein